MSGDFVPGIGNEVITTFTVLLFLGSVLLLSLRGRFSFFYQQLSNYIAVTLNYRAPEDIGAGTANTSETHQPAAYNSGTCPICLNEHSLPLETNCGHVFCGNCIRSYYDNGNFFTSGMGCPLCRQRITMFFICFTPLEQEGSIPIVQMVRSYNERFSGAPRPFLSYLRDWPTLMRHLWNEFFTVGGLVYMFRIRIVMCFLAGIVYLFSPLDIIPEAIFGVLGLLDDLFVLCLLGVYISIIYRRVVLARNVQ